MAPVPRFIKPCQMRPRVRHAPNIRNTHISPVHHEFSSKLLCSICLGSPLQPGYSATILIAIATFAWSRVRLDLPTRSLVVSLNILFGPKWKLISCSRGPPSWIPSLLCSDCLARIFPAMSPILTLARTSTSAETRPNSGA